MKLEWKETESNKMTWDEAKDLEINGWRLPTRGELCDAYDTSINGFKASYYWSSSTLVRDTNFAWLVYFSDGNVDYGNKTSSYYVRLCRELKE
jgi:hypothetical protein